MVCMETVNADEMYVVNCGSTVDHTMCQTCADSWRAKMPITSQGRKLTCPSCRGPEIIAGERSKESLEKELAEVYALLARTNRARNNRNIPQVQIRFATRNLNEELRSTVMTEIVAVAQNVPVTRREWCQSGRLQRELCFTRNRTARECSMAGCQRRVCRACVMCDSHSEF